MFILTLQVVVGPVPPVLLPHGAHHAVHGAGMLPLPLPQLLQMTQAAAVELGVVVGEGGEGTRKAIGPGGETSPDSQGATLGPALTALINAIEDVFMSTGEVKIQIRITVGAKVRARTSVRVLCIGSGMARLPEKWRVLTA